MDDKPIGTVLMVEDATWKVAFATQHLAGIHCTRPLSPGEGHLPADRAGDARRLEILMDQLVTLADDSAYDASDELLLELMYERDRTLAGQLRDLDILEHPDELVSPLQRATWELLRKANLRGPRTATRRRR